MKLLFPKVLDHLTNKAIVWCDLTDPYSLRRARSSAAALAPQMERAEKFIFDSGTDNDHDFVGAVRETALEMMQAGLFHLPHPVTWIEDPFES